MKKRKRNPLRKPWTPLEVGPVNPELLAFHEFWEKAYTNNTYQVLYREVEPTMEGWPKITHLSIKRHDRKAIHDWRDLQRIKNEVCGPEREAVEIYPAESRLMDTSNQFHCWVFPAGVTLSEVFVTKPGPKRRPLEQRLWEKVDLSGGPDVCWPFDGAGSKYGRISRPGDSTNTSPYFAHRVAYALSSGLDPEDIPDGLEVMHSCDNPRCCNPAHLSLGTSKDNKQDAISKNRMFWQRAQRDAEGKFVTEGDPPEKEDD